MSSSAHLKILSGKRVASCKVAILNDAKVSGLTPAFWPMQGYPWTQRQSIRSSIVLVTACVMLLFKSIRYCSSSVAVETFEALLPLLSDLIAFN